MICTCISWNNAYCCYLNFLHVVCPMQFTDKLSSLKVRHKELNDKLMAPGINGEEIAKYSKELSDLTPILEKIETYTQVQKDAEDARAMVADKALDAEMKAMAEEELDDAEKRLPALLKEVQLALLPKDVADDKNAILEIRAGTGGEEAALFAADLFRMYQRFAVLQNWKFEIISINDTGIGGYKEAQAEISGQNVFAKLKFESGVHRVQRVPQTETQGRVHTSAATVAVLPEAEEVDIQINESDLRIDVFRASGPGGQSVNTTDSAVRIVHVPTGITVQQQDEKSQHKNKAKALKVLRARLYDAERQKRDAERSANRKSMVGSGDRSERIRTYNYPQSRVTDHRINFTSHQLDAMLSGEELIKFIDELTAHDQAERLSEVG